MLSLGLWRGFLRHELRLGRLLSAVRHGRENEAWEGKNIKEIVEGLREPEPEVDLKVDIGLPPPPRPSMKELSERKKLFFSNRQNAEMERRARNISLEVDFDEVREEWEKSDAARHIQMAAEHYNIFEDLFGEAYFSPHVMMDIYYPQEGGDLVAPVCWGNVVKPKEAFLQPEVRFQSGPEELWTLTMVNPDGHFTMENMEYVHWFVGNIKGGDVRNGETIWDYLPPFPPRGLGFQRLVFILYKQEKKLDFSRLKQQLPCLELKDRSFKTLDFYREWQDQLTPAGLSFFQSDWDKTAKKIFHEVLNMDEPVFEYDFPPQLLKKQTWFPLKEPFNMYLDRYRDPRDVNQEYLVKKLKETDPFAPPKNPFPYPKAVRLHYKKMPSWLIRKEEYYKLGKGRVTNLLQDEYE